MAQVRLSEDLRPLSDLKTQTSEIIQQAQASGRPVVHTWSSSAPWTKPSATWPKAIGSSIPR